jgi:carboxyl-terminal processing protease
MLAKGVAVEASSVLNPVARRTRGLRFVVAIMMTLLALVVAAGCTAGGSSSGRTGNARVDPSEEGGRPTGQTGARGSASSTPGGSDGTLSSTELGLVYQFIMQRYIEQVDHATLVEAAIAAVHETGLRSNALPLDLATTDLVPTPTGEPDRDWMAFARGYDALVGKHPQWAAQARPDWAILRKMIATLGDDHSLFMDPQDVKRTAETGFTGVGIRVTRPRPEEPPYVTEVFRDSPASAAGVKAGDQITAVDSKTTDGLSLTEIVTSIRGAQGSKVVLSVVRGGQPPVDIQITRAPVDAPRVEGAVRGGVLGVLRIRSFGDGVPEQVQQLLTQGRNRGARAWILDLRGNPGGSLEAMARVATNFIAQRPVGLAVDRNGQSDPIVAPGRPAIPTFPYVVIVDRETASGAELLAAAIKEYQIAPVVGVRTAGSVGLASPQPLSDGSAIQVTIRRLVSPSGAVINKQGVEPDFEADLTIDDLQRGDDPQLLQAIELLASGPLQGAPAPSASPAPATVIR